MQAPIKIPNIRQAESRRQQMRRFVNKRATK